MHPGRSGNSHQRPPPCHLHRHARTCSTFSFPFYAPFMLGLTPCGLNLDSCLFYDCPNKVWLYFLSPMVRNRNLILAFRMTPDLVASLPIPVKLPSGFLRQYLKWWPALGSHHRNSVTQLDIWGDMTGRGLPVPAEPMLAVPAEPMLTVSAEPMPPSSTDSSFPV